MNYAIIRFLKARLNKEMRLFEYGSGYSTQFFASLVQSVTSVEYDEAWYGLVKERIPRNVELVYKRNDEDGEYCRSIVATASKFHIVIVDGRDRVNCIKQSVGALTENGVIVLDDAQRERYAVGLDYARARGFKVLSFEGLKPTGSSNETAAILYRSENNCLDI